MIVPWVQPDFLYVVNLYNYLSMMGLARGFSDDIKYTCGWGTQKSKVEKDRVWSIIVLLFDNRRLSTLYKVTTQFNVQWLILSPTCTCCRSDNLYTSLSWVFDNHPRTCSCYWNLSLNRYRSTPLLRVWDPGSLKWRYMNGDLLKCVHVFSCRQIIQVTAFYDPSWIHKWSSLYLFIPHH